MSARLANVGFGGWLAVSAFLWQHSTPQRVNAVVVGTLVAVLALLGRRGLSWAHSTNMLLAIWLVFSVIVLRPAEATTVVNHLFVGLAILLLTTLVALEVEQGPQSALLTCRCGAPRPRGSRNPASGSSQALP